MAKKLSLLFCVSAMFVISGCETKTEPATAVVVRHEWSNQQDVEQYVTKRVVGIEVVPGGGRVVANRQETRLTLTYTRKKGLRPTTKQVTVYDYDYDAWELSRTATVADVGTACGTWPDLSGLQSNGSVGSQRAAGRRSSRVLVVRVDGNELRFAPQEAFWAAVQDGETLLAQLTEDKRVMSLARVEE